MDESPISDQIAIDDDVLAEKWEALVERIQARFGRRPDIDGLLFLIGVQSVGRGYEPDLPKERKQSLIMEGSYLAFETLGIYARAGMERNGFLIWVKNVELPPLSVQEQEKLLQIGILNYFDEADFRDA